MTLLALLTAGTMLAMWFPVKALWSQQAQINSTAHQIAMIEQQQSTLDAQAHSISSTAAATRLARQQYQLVEKGQSLIQVLPGTATNGSGPYGGDPGNQPLVAPSSVTNLDHASAASHPHAATTGFWQRLVRTLEFWR